MAQGGISEKLTPNQHSYDAIVIGSGMGALAFCQHHGQAAEVARPRPRAPFQNRRIHAHLQPAGRLDLGCRPSLRGRNGPRHDRAQALRFHHRRPCGLVAHAGCLRCVRLSRPHRKSAKGPGKFRANPGGSFSRGKDRPSANISVTSSALRAGSIGVSWRWSRRNRSAGS